MTEQTGFRTPPRVQSWPLPDDPVTGPIPPAHRAEPRARRTIAALAFLLGAGLAMLLGPVLGGPGGGPGGQPPGISSSQVGGNGTTST